MAIYKSFSEFSKREIIENKNQDYVTSILSLTRNSSIAYNNVQCISTSINTHM